MTPEELVLKQFPGRLYITLVEAGRALGFTAQTAYNKHSTGTFPLPVRKIGSKPMVSVSDLINYMAAPTQEAAAQPPRARRPGRPRAADHER